MRRRNFKAAVETVYKDAHGRTKKGGKAIADDHT